MPADIFKPRRVDESFQWEAEQIKDAGGEIIVFNAENLSERRKPIFNIPVAENITNAFYRGWMLPQKDYSFLELSLKAHKINLQTSMPLYTQAHHLPGWYETFKTFTPKSFWFSPHHQQYNEEQAKALDTDAFIVKDYVKSRKNEWDTACYASNLETLPVIIDNFIQRQKEENSLVGGVVIRAFEEFNKNVGEVRVWWVKGAPVFISNHPDNTAESIDVDKYFLRYLADPVSRLGNPFITTDLALNSDGQWRVVEVGDGQVSGLPKNVDASALWKALLA